MGDHFVKIKAEKRPEAVTQMSIRSRVYKIIV